jgi:hypothetical protein
MEAGNVKFLKSGQGVFEMGVTNPHTIVIPPRPFIRQPFDNSKEKLIKAAEQLMAKIVDGTIDRHGALEVLGDVLLIEIRKSINNREYEPNAPSTIRKKGSDMPLVDTGRLLQSLKIEVR